MPPLTVDVFERIVEFNPAFDKRDSDPKKDHGIHGVEMRWILKGAKGAVQFLVFTNWQLPHITQEGVERMKHARDVAMELRCFWMPMAADLGYHSKFPMYEGQEPMGSVDTKIAIDPAKEGFERFDMSRTPTGTFTPCPYLDGAPCYYDGSGLHAETVLRMLIEKGGEAVWQYMEQCYHSQFDNLQIGAPA
jgi:hypothetical protein